MLQWEHRSGGPHSSSAGRGAAVGPLRVRPPEHRRSDAGGVARELRDARTSLPVPGHAADALSADEHGGPAHATAAADDAESVQRRSGEPVVSGYPSVI